MPYRRGPKPSTAPTRARSRRSGWYDHPQGTVASAAQEAQLKRDGIDLKLEDEG
jgi:hypothetical protein